MIDEVEKQGEMETIIKKACELSEEAHLDFGRVVNEVFKLS